MKRRAVAFYVILCKVALILIYFLVFIISLKKFLNEKILYDNLKINKKKIGFIAYSSLSFPFSELSIFYFS